MLTVLMLLLIPAVLTVVIGSLLGAGTRRDSDAAEQAGYLSR